MYFKSKLEPLSIRKLLKVHFDDKLTGQWRTSERRTSVYRAPERRRRRRVFTRFLSGDPVVFVSAGRCGGCGGGNPVGGGRWGVHQTTTTTIMVQMAPRASSYPAATTKRFMEMFPCTFWGQQRSPCNVARIRCCHVCSRAALYSVRRTRIVLFGCAERVLRPSRRAQRVRTFAFLPR